MQFYMNYLFPIAAIYALSLEAKWVPLDDDNMKLICKSCLRFAAMSEE